MVVVVEVPVGTVVVLPLVPVVKKVEEVVPVVVGAVEVGRLMMGPLKWFQWWWMLRSAGRR